MASVNHGRKPPPRLSDVVADTLRKDILAGELQPGARLDIGELSERFGISRTPIDDGLRRLEDEGMIVVAPRRGTFVAPLDERDLEEAFEIRAALEVLAARRAADHHNGDDVDQLNEILSKLAEAIERRDVDEHWRWNAAFHEQLVKMSRNQRLLGLYDNLHSQITIARVHARSAGWTGRSDLELREHQAIVDAVSKGDADAAAAAAATHIDRAARSLTADLAALKEPADADR